MSVAPLGLVLALLAAPTASGESIGALLQRQSQELADAPGSGNPEVWEKYLDPEARYIDESGAVQHEEGPRRRRPALPGRDLRLDQAARLRSRSHGDDVAVATYVNDENEDYHGAKLHCQYRTTETWVKRPEAGAWSRVRSLRCARTRRRSRSRSRSAASTSASTR